jgi:RimJ/RimL family protein N-acetyltransferase
VHHLTRTAELTVPATSTHPPLTVRPWRLEDLPAVIEARQDPALRHWTSSGPTQAADADAWIRSQEASWSTGERLAFAVLDAATLLGSVVLKNLDAPEVGYWTTAAARGRGVAPSALGALTAWAFSYGVQSIGLLHQLDNTASCRVAVKSGYPLEAIKPAHPPAYPLPGHVHRRHRESA